MEQQRLEFETRHYPDKPGFKAQETSRQAAEDIDPRAITMRKKILRVLRVGQGMTPDETAKLLEENILAIRPRFSELHAAGFIEKSGLTRKNDSGKQAIVWVLTGHKVNERLAWHE